MSSDEIAHQPSGILLPVIVIALFYATIITTALIKESSPNEKLDTIYHPIKKERYVIGRYRFNRHPDFIDLTTLGIETGNPEQYLRRDAAHALKSLITEFHNSYPDTRVWVESATRSYWQQKNIWEAKWQGKQKVEGINLAQTVNKEIVKAKMVLRYSAMPGVSRHHWGTDVDFNELRNDYFDSGPGKILFQWLQQNALRFDFCQPYTVQRNKGHLEERWHWSYRPMARIFLKDWNSIFFTSRTKQLAMLRFDGSHSALNMAQVYANNINQQCK